MKLNQQIDQAATRYIESFLKSRIFQWCIFHRYSMALLLLILGVTYLYCMFVLLQQHQPDILESIEFIFLVSLPLGTCLYFTCGFHIVTENRMDYQVDTNGLNNDMRISNPFENLYVDSLTRQEEEEEEENQDAVPLLYDVESNSSWNSEEDFHLLNASVTDMEHSLNGV